MKIPVDAIIIGDRVRRDLGDDFEELKASIQKRGLINAVCVEREDYRLVAGFRRLLCHKQLGIKEIEVKFYEDLSPLDRKLLELEENIHKELTWNEKAVIRAEIHKLQQEIHGIAIKGHESNGWGLKDTAESLNVSPATLSQDIALVEAMQVIPEIKERASRTQALKMLDRMEEIQILTELARRDSEESKEKFKQLPYALWCGEASDVLNKNVDDETVDLVIFDPPWGIDIHKADARGLSGVKTSFGKDTKEDAIDICLKILPEIHRVMKEDAHMYMFIGIQFLDLYVNLLTGFRQLEDRIMTYIQLFPEVQSAFEKILKVILQFRAACDWKFHVEDVPLIWVKEGGGFTDFDTKFMPRYEAILFCSKGVRKTLNDVSSNVLEFKRPATTERIHTQEKPVDLLQRLIRLSTQQDEIVLDPCAGSFATIVAATKTKRRSVGIDNDQVSYAKGLERLSGLKITDET